MTDGTQSQAEEHKTKASSISERKREANRKNAQRSTGPKTEAGKNHSRRNAVKHGFLTKVLPVPEFEHSAEIRTFSEELIKNAQPEGPLERFQVDLIVQACWKLRRFQVAENAAIELGIRRAEELWRYEPYAYRGDEWIDRFWKVRKSIELHGYADPATVEGLRGLTIDGGLKSEFRHANEKARALAEEKANDATGVREEEFRKAQSDLGRVLEELWDRACELDFHFEKSDARRRLPYLLERLVPHSSAETMLRYQTATLNQLYRAMAELERLQRQRRGEVLPSPLRLTI